MTGRASYLFARPSFFEGVGRLADFCGALNQYNWSATPKEADETALEQDVAAVIEELAGAVVAARAELAAS